MNWNISQSSFYVKYTALDIVILLKYRELFTILPINIIIFISVFKTGQEYKFRELKLHHFHE